VASGVILFVLLPSFDTVYANMQNNLAIFYFFACIHKYMFLFLSVFCRLKNQIPDLENSLDMIRLLQEQRDNPKEIETEFLLCEQVYFKAMVPPTDKVCLWLGVSINLN
jgi:hypothetical protein